MSQALDSASESPPPTAANRGGKAVHSQTPQPRRSQAQPLWMAQYQIALVTFDLCCVIAATLIGYYLRFGELGQMAGSVNYLVIGGGLAVGWSIALQAAGAYEIRHLASGPEEAKRVLRASAITVSVLAIYSYATKTEVARGFVLGVIPLGVVLLLLERAGVRRFVHQQRRRGRWVHRILAVGTPEAVRRLLTATQSVSESGLQVVGVCLDDTEPGTEFEPGLPVLGPCHEAATAAGTVDADVIAVAGHAMKANDVRELGWQLEGTARGLVVAPALTEVAGPRIHVSPVEGLPLVWLDRPQLGRLPRMVKRSVDLVGGTVLLVVALPMLLLTAMAIKLSSRGPVLFKQRRLGINGGEFTMLKFRSMYVDAERRRESLMALNEQDGGGVLFKMRRDPRVTPVGRLIRQYSIDELPQLVHVVTGTMSLVGPRPLAAADSGYTGSARRRLLVRPGLTGLWQVKGRSDLSWDDAVRLDLYYVENWSISMDAAILARTVLAVLGRKGAY